MFQTNVVEKIGTQFYAQQRFIYFENNAVYEVIKNIIEAGSHR